MKDMNIGIDWLLLFQIEEGFFGVINHIPMITADQCNWVVLEAI